jgi:hypothetical protein
MPYQITEYSQKKAKALGVQIKPSTNPKKKIDVFRKGNKLQSIGATGYGDYSTYLKTKGKEYADQRQKLYKQRHAKDRQVAGSAGFFADRILW